MMIARKPSLDEQRRETLRTTRPRTQSGDDSPRADSLILNLCASVIVPEDADLVQKRSREYFKTLRPQNNYHCWCVTQIALISIRIDRDQRIERRVRDKIVIKAELFWDSDRNLDAVRLGSQLGNQPEEVVELLQRTPHGCDWLIGRWAKLAQSAEVQNKIWTPQQTDLAFDLLGTPALFREGQKPGTLFDSEGRAIVGSDDPASVASRQIAELKARRERVEGLDQVNRSLAMADLGDDSDPELRKLRRHESTLHSRLRWFTQQLRFQSPEKEPYRGLWASWIGDHEHENAPQVVPPTPLPEAMALPKVEETTPGRRFPMPHPPFDLEPDEFDMAGNIPLILANRRDKKLKKAEARRDAKRRVAEKLRA